ncbi:unnamed protein product [Closterium sp. NIES-54]
MTTLRVLLHIAAQRDYELHSLDFSTAILQGSLHEEIWLRCPPRFTGSFPAGTQWSLRWPVYSLRQAPRLWHDTLRTMLAALGFSPSTADPSLFLRTDTLLPPFYILVYVDDLVFATADIEALALVKSELQKRHTCTDMAPPLDESIEPSGPYPELVGCLMYLMTCIRPDLAYPLSILARYVAPERHRPEHWEATKRVLRYLCSTSGMRFMLGGRGPFVLTGHADASWIEDLATQRSSEGYTFSLGSGSVSWRSTRPSSVLSSSCYAEIYAGAMDAQELRWLTYLLTDLGEWPRSPPILTSGMGLVLGGRGPVVLTGHADASWVDNLATQRSSQGYTFSLGSGSVSWRSTRCSSVLSSSCEAEIYAGAMAAQKLRWLTYLLTDLGEAPRSPPVLYFDNKAMLALCQEHRLEHRTKHIALRYFLARELQQCGQLRLAYVATRANTADIFTKALQSGDHQRFYTVLGLVPTLPHLLTT